MEVDTRLVALEARLLQNSYAHAIDARNWDLFRTVFAPDVAADYPRRRYEGIAEWLDDFVPFHDTCSWTLHMMSNHLVGHDADGVWASCYGDVRWQLTASADRYSHTLGMYQDRLALIDGAWVIARRKFRMVLLRPDVPMADGMALPTSVEALTNDR